MQTGLDRVPNSHCTKRLAIIATSAYRVSDSDLAFDHMIKDDPRCSSDAAPARVIRLAPPPRASLDRRRWCVGGVVAVIDMQSLDSFGFPDAPKSVNACG